MGIGIGVLLLALAKIAAIARVHQSRYKFTRQDTNMTEITSLKA